MDAVKLRLSISKYSEPVHWVRDPLHQDSLPYFGYVEVVLAELPVIPSCVLDAGCGDGRISAEIVKKGHSVTGIDLLDVNVRHAREKVPGAIFIKADLRKNLAEVGLPEKVYDVVVMVEAYEHIPPEDCPSVCANIRSLLNEDGKLILSVPSMMIPKSQLHYRHFTCNEIINELERNGFCIEKVVYQHRIGTLTSIIMSPFIERLLPKTKVFYGSWLKIRRYLYMRFCNRSRNDACGRFIVIAKHAALSKKPV